MRCMRRVVALFLPGGLVTFTAVLLLRPGAVPAPVIPHIRAFSPLVLAAGVFLGWHYDQSRIVCALLVLTIADAALWWAAIGAPQSGDFALTIVGVLAVLLPVNLVAYSALNERGPLRSRCLRRLVPILAQVIAVGLLARGNWPAITVWLNHSFIAAVRTEWTAIPLAGLAVFGLAILFLTIRCALYQDFVGVGFMWALVSAFWALHGALRGWDPTPFFAAGGWVLIGSLIGTGNRTGEYDDLTELPGWRALREALLQQGGRYALALVSVDHFSHLRSTLGRQVGDQVLRMVATQLRRISGGGTAHRFGRETFAVLFTDVPAVEAVSHLDAARRTIASYCFVLRGPGRPRNKPAVPTPPTGPRVAVTVTVSVGMAERDCLASRPRHVIRAARQALWHAIESGRNLVSVWSPDGTPELAPLHPDRQIRSEEPA
jgi:GGDEF domain-containing protein